MAVVKSPRVAQEYDRYGRHTLETKVVKKKRGAAKLSRSLTTTPIAVIVGKKPETFYIHETFLCANSGFFKNYLKPEWSGNGKPIKLPVLDPIAFKVYANWLYQDHIGITKEELMAKPESSAPKSSELEWNTWIDCYDLCWFVQDTDFSDALIDFAIDKMSADEEYIDNLPSVIYTRTTRTSPHRKFVVDLATKVWLQASLKGVANDGSMDEFLVDLGVASLDVLRNGGLKAVGVYDFFKGKDTCIYHEHTSNKTPCYKVKQGLP